MVKLLLTKGHLLQCDFLQYHIPILVATHLLLRSLDDMEEAHQSLSLGRQKLVQSFLHALHPSSSSWEGKGHQGTNQK
jgi:hypothetical protein